MIMILINDNTFLKMNIVNYPGSIIVTEPAREGKFRNVESQTEVGVSRHHCEAATDEEVSQEDQLDKKS